MQEINHGQKTMVYSLIPAPALGFMSFELNEKKKGDKIAKLKILEEKMQTKEFVIDIVLF